MDSRSFAAPLLLLAAVLAAGPGPGPGDGVVRCMPLRQPARAASAAGETGLAVEPARLFAPTRQAVFFSRSGDRCAWHDGGPARG